MVGNIEVMMRNAYQNGAISISQNNGLEEKLDESWSWSGCMGECFCSVASTFIWSVSQQGSNEILKDGFCLNMVDTPLSPMKVVTNLQEAIWDADIVVNGLPSTETREVFEEIGNYWKERITPPIILFVKGHRSGFRSRSPHNYSYADDQWGK